MSGTLRIYFLFSQTMQIKRNADGLSALPRPSLDNEELVSFPKVTVIMLPKEFSEARRNPML